MGMNPHPPGPALPALRSHLYWCNYAMKSDGRRAYHITVEKSIPNRKETLIISVKFDRDKRKMDDLARLSFKKEALYGTDLISGLVL